MILRACSLLAIVVPSAAFVGPVPNSYTRGQSNGYEDRYHATRPSFGLDDKDDNRLVDIRTALDRMNILMSDDAGSSPSMQDFQNRIRKLVSIGESSIPGAGRGLFATQNIRKGTVIGFYPVHGIGAEFEDETSVCFGGTQDDQNYFDKIQKSDYTLFLVGSRRLGNADFEDASIFVDVNPNRANQSVCWNGHLVNDGAVLSENSERGMLDYYVASHKKRNCVHIPFGPSPLLALVTTKKVKKGEELFTTYGCVYWLETVLKEGEECADTTEAIQLQARETAEGIFNAMKSAQSMYDNQQTEVEETFSAMCCREKIV